MPLEPPSLLVGHHVCAPALSTPIPTRSTGQISRARPRCPLCTSDVAAGSLRSVWWRIMPCQRHVAPHNPSRFETTVDTPRQRSVHRTLPASIRCTTSCPTENSRGQVSTRRSTTPLPQATVGPGATHPQHVARRLQAPGPHPPPAGPLPDTSSDVPDASRQSSGGVTQKPISDTPSASMVGGS